MEFTIVALVLVLLVLAFIVRLVVGSTRQGGPPTERRPADSSPKQTPEEDEIRSERLANRR